jgi:DNA-binding transcriptional MocR family regulator
VNIRAVMAVLGTDDLDHSDKCVLLAVACHAGRYNAATDVSIGGLASDLAVAYATVSRALVRLEAGGLLSGVRRPGQSTVWTVHLALLERDPTSRSDDGVPRASGARPPRASGARQKESLEKREGAGYASENLGNSHVNSHVKPTTPTPWVELLDGTVKRA